MVATAARIGFITRPHRSIVVTDATAASEFGDDARDTKDRPIESFFNDLGDAETMAEERIDLVGVKRRLFTSRVQGLDDLADDFAYSEVTPTVNVIDREKDADMNCAVVQIGVDLRREQKILVNWG